MNGSPSSALSALNRRRDRRRRWQRVQRWLHGLLPRLSLTRPVPPYVIVPPAARCTMAQMRSDFGNGAWEMNYDRDDRGRIGADIAADVAPIDPPAVPDVVLDVRWSV